MTDLSLSDRRVAIIGGNGSGKSTLPRYLAAKGALVLDDTTPDAAVALTKAKPRTRILASAGTAPSNIAAGPAATSPPPPNGKAPSPASAPWGDQEPTKLHANTNDL